MEKSRTLIITYALSLFFIIFNNTEAQGQFSANESYSSINEIMAEGKEHYNFVGDTAYFKLKNKEYFVLCGDNHSGMMMQTIYLFEGITLNSEIFWALICMRFSYAQSVQIKLSIERQEVIFLSEKEKIIMTIPFESLDSKDFRF